MTNTLLTLLSQPDVRAFYQAGHWRPDTIYSLVRRIAESTPEKPAVRERGRRVSYGDLVEAADRLAAFLHAGGLRPGMRVASWLPSRAESAVVVLACSRNGYVCCPSLHRDHTVGEIDGLLRRMRAAALVAERGYGADADRADIFEVAEAVNSLLLALPLVPLGGTVDGASPLLPDVPAAADPGKPWTDPDSVVYLAFTSGTTGEPKGVMHSDNTLLAPVRALAADWSLDGEATVYSVSPLSHNLGFGAMLLSLTHGGELVVHDLPRGASLADRFAETATTFAYGVPTHAIDLLEELRRGTAAPGRLRGFRISGAAVPPVVARGLLEHGIVPQSGYGMTEAGSHHYTRPDDDPAVIVGTSGRTCAAYEVRVVSQEDPEVDAPAGEIGQVAGRGASLMLGYFDDQFGTEGSFNSSGWFLTGDLGWVDDEGYLRITGRKKDLIIRGGHNIYPTRIENLAHRFEEVAHAAAIPVPDERLGEKVCLIVTGAGGCDVDPDRLLAHLDAAGLSKYDMPEYFAQATEMPLLPSGKVLKRRLREWVEDGALTPVAVRFGGR